uniref:Candidate secreted effector n=1 Tax=Meloidogyne incognita TaxID=6306 RepID=A0A914LUT6_MELIC
MNEEEEEDDDEDMFDVDEEASALEQMMAPKQSNSHISVAEQPLLNSIKVEQSSIQIEAISPQKMANNEQNLTENIKKSPSKNNKKSILHEDLELSESSSSEESDGEGEEESD